MLESRLMKRPAVSLFCLLLPLTIAGMNLSAGVLTALLFFTAASGKDPGFRHVLKPFMGCLLFYFACAAVSALAGVDPKASLPAWGKDLHKLWLSVILLIALGSDPEPRAYRALGLGFSAIALIGLWQAGFSGGGGWARPHGFVHPVTYGQQLAMAFLGGLCFLGRAEAGADSPWAKRAAPAFLALTASALLFNQTRAAFLGLAAGLAAVCPFAPALRRRALWMLAAAAAVMVSWELLPTGRSLSALFDTAIASSQDPHRQRLALWSAAWDIFRDHPWTGSGPGTFRFLFPAYHAGPMRDDVWGSVHNLYLHQLAERGLLGLAALLLVFGSLTLRAYRRCAQAATPWNLWSLSCCAAFLVMNAAESAFYSEQITALFLFSWAWAEGNHGARREML